MNIFIATVSISLWILFSSSVIFPVSAQSQASYKSLREFDSSYPNFDEEACKAEATRQANEKFKRVAVGDKVSVVPKVGRSAEGTFNGLSSSGGVKIGITTIPRNDLSDEDKLRFGVVAETEKLKEQFKESFLAEKKRDYLSKKQSARKDLAFRLSETQGDIIVKTTGEFIWDVKIISSDESSVDVKHARGKEKIKYNDIRFKSLALIKSDGVLRKKSGESYEGAKVISNSSANIIFYDAEMKKHELPTSELSEESLVKLGLLKASHTNGETVSSDSEAELQKKSKEGMPQEGYNWTAPELGMEFVWIKDMECWVGKYEVTNFEFKKFRPDHKPRPFIEYALDEDRQPVVWVSSKDASEYAEWLTKRELELDRLSEEYEYRLPSGQEWYIFSTCGEDREFPWGKEMPPKYGNYSGKEIKDARLKKIRTIPEYSDGSKVTCHVDKSGQNEWGLFGVGGNAWECTIVSPSDKSFDGWRGGAWNISVLES
ncbi:MAG TPA: SUMF1/EgtB/PvdO family nonheme iron enzyme, partial [Victivallales bacterium]|nr:SUMF1/EgtB/PvdO family nonheme iron enzyme [Victivallales bacterium]